MAPGVQAAVAAGLPLALFCALATPAAAFHRHCDDCDIPFEWDDGAAQPPVVAPFPQGFALTVPITFGTSAPGRPATLNRYAEVGGVLGRCLAADLSPGDARWQDLTLRLSFKRDGSINGVPRIAHVSAPSAEATTVQSRDRLLGALARCTPLPLSPALGRAVAGQIFAIRFVQQRNS